MFNSIRHLPGKNPFSWVTLLIMLYALALSASCQPLEQTVSQAQHIENPAAEGARLPHLAALPDGGVLMSWVETLDAGHALKFAVFRHGYWERQGEVSRGVGWFVNWADYPSVVAIDKSFWVAHWLIQSTGERAYDYDVLVSVSVDAGQTWSTPRPPYQDRTTAEHGFVSIFPVENEAGIVWLDGRDYHTHKSGNFSLRYARIHRDGRFGTEQVIDDSTCTCCWTAAAVTASGPVIAWRSRRVHEIRDHHIARLAQDRWTSPSPLSQEGWSIDGCPVNGPSLAAHDNHIVAGWFTAEGNRPRVRAAFSNGDTLRFNGAFDVDEAKPAGRIQIEWLNEQAAMIMWLSAMDSVTKKASLATRKIYTDGTMGPIKRLINISPGRDSGIPQLIKKEDGFILAWTKAAPDYGVQTVHFPFETLE